jgi:molybdopterin-guanine dinucleotide biosynthesis protein A
MTGGDSVTLAVQAGGRSSRMGRDKGLVEVGGRPLAQHVIDRLGALAQEILITTMDPEAYAALGFRTVVDESPGAGALDGLRTALRAAGGDRVLVCACDMPFASEALARAMLALAASAEAVVPRNDGDFEPLFAVYRRACLPAIERALAEGRRRVISFFPEVDLRVLEEADLRSIDPDPWSFFNVNTPSDLELAEEHWRAASTER